VSIKAIHAIKGHLGLSDPDYRALLMRVAGVSSSKLLTAAQDRAVMDELKAMEPVRAKRPKTAAERKIWALWLGTDSEPGLSRFLPEEKRTAAYLAGFVDQFGKVRWFGQNVRFDEFTPGEAKKAIEALKDRIAKERNRLNEVPF